MSEFISKNVGETEGWARRLALSLKGGETLALSGHLGAGKTLIVKALAQAWGVDQNITSPTFVLLKVYAVRHKSIKKMVHVDCYRLDGQEDLSDIGLADYLQQLDTVVVIEWADKIRGLPTDTIRIDIEHQGAERRKIKIEGLDL